MFRRHACAPDIDSEVVAHDVPDDDSGSERAAVPDDDSDSESVTGSETASDRAVDFKDLCVSQLEEIVTQLSSVERRLGRVQDMVQGGFVVMMAINVACTFVAAWGTAATLIGGGWRQVGGAT
jgi:hypothetical protein